MFDKVMLGVRGDLAPLKKRLFEAPDCVPALSFASAEERAGTHTVCLAPDGNTRLFNSFLNALAEYILDRYEPQLLRRLLRENYSFLGPAQIRQALREAQCFSDDGLIGYNARKRAVLLSLREYFRDEQFMLLDGFVSFRLREYELLLTGLAERLAEECVTRREYEDFISLLQYFVNMQEGRPRLAHVVVMVDGRYELLADGGENITRRCLADFVDDERIPEDANFDDLLISMLITLAPENITVHNADQIRNKELFKTIRRVFDGHLSYCTGCELCGAKGSFSI